MEGTLRDNAIDRANRDHAPEVYRVAHGVHREAEEALDVTQNAFAVPARPLVGGLHPGRPRPGPDDGSGRPACDDLHLDGRVIE